MARVIGLLVVLLSMWRADSSRADTLEGVLHVSGSTAHVLRWTLVRDADAVTWRSWYRTTSGAIDAEDELRWDGDSPGSYRYTRTPIGEIASVVRAGDSLIHRQTRAGVLRQRREPFHPDVLAGPMPIPFAQRHWQRLESGERLRFRYAVLDQLRSFAFSLERDPSHPAAGPGRAVVRMAPDSAVLRLVVPPVFLVFTPDGSGFRSLIGRMLPVAVEGRNIRPIDGVLVVTEVKS